MNRLRTTVYIYKFIHIFKTDTVSLEQVILMYIGCVFLTNTNFHISELHLPQTNNQRLVQAETGGYEVSVVHLQHYQTFHPFNLHAFTLNIKGMDP